MKGYIIYDAATGRLMHHGIHTDLPLPSMGEEVREITTEEAAQIPPARGALFISPPSQLQANEAEIAKIGDYTLIERMTPYGPLPPSIESSLEKAIDRNTAAVEALTDRIDKLFAR